MSGAEGLVAWLREQIEADLAAARIIGAGGFAPQRWDADPPGQVNPEKIPASRQVTEAIGACHEEVCGWVQIVAYDRLNNEPPEADCRDSTAPVILVDNGRREFEHIIRNDPRNTVARCEAELGILDAHRLVVADRGLPEQGQSWGSARGYRIIAEHPDEKDIERAAGMHWDLDCREYRKRFPCRTVRLLGTGYKHRPGYQESWAP